MRKIFCSKINFFTKNRLSFTSTLLNPHRQFASLNLGNQHDTIFQLSSGLGNFFSPGGAVGIAVIRISGQLATTCYHQITREKTLPKPRLATRCKLYIPNKAELLDSGLALYFPAPNSFTGEDVIEFHVHGNRIIVKEVLEALSTISPSQKSKSAVKIRVATGGEFTRRAFEHGKLDLTQVEGLADLLAAETEEQRSQAVRQMDGDLSRLYEKWRSELMTCLAHCEAVIDFSEDEKDVAESTILSQVLPRVQKLQLSLRSHLHDGRRGELVRSGLKVAIAGMPNVGKSTLLNTLAQRDVAIVSATPGTTRDVLEVSLNIKGFPIQVYDTAGLRATTDEIEEEGIARAKRKLDQADLKLILYDIPSISMLPFLLSDTKDDPKLTSIATEWRTKNILTTNFIDENTIVVFTKTDLSDQLVRKWESLKKDRSIISKHLLNLIAPTTSPRAISLISCKTGAGLQDLLDLLYQQLQSRLESASSYNREEPVLTRLRHRQHIETCLLSLEAFHDHMKQDDLVLACEMLREATRCLGRIVGIVDVEHLLDVIFKDFCIGK